jgi:penicillin-binding protein 2
LPPRRSSSGYGSSSRTSRYQVNALGEPTPGGKLAQTPPVPGRSLKLTINQAVQEAGEAALAERGLPGAFVTMNIHTGEILGMGSFPTYDPSVWTNLSQKEYTYLAESESKPLFNRAVESAYPTGSTYKIITGLAGLENGYVTGSTVVDDNGYIELGTQKFENSEGEVNGPITLTHAYEVSSDVYFYKLGARMWDTPDLQDWSHKMGIGDPTGIDIPDNFDGLVPSKQWRDELFEEELTDRPWSQGDDVQLAVGQGDLQTDPLQMAIAYSALGNGGTIVTPHLGKEVLDAAGRVLKEIDPGPRRHVEIKPESRQLIMEGLHLATSGPGGTATTTFQGFPIEIAGKTGTAERYGQENQAWFISLAPYPNPNVVTVVTIEQGGFGAESAAPANRQILEAYFHNTLKKESDKETKEAEEAYEGETYEGEYGTPTEGESEEVPAEESYEEEAPVEEETYEEAPPEETGVEETGGVE